MGQLQETLEAALHLWDGGAGGSREQSLMSLDNHSR